jgi:chemotaxis-related protein WspB
MQILTFTVAGQPCAIESRSVIEVLPLVPARPIPLMPDYVRGIFTYRGRLVPLIDLGRRFAVGHEAAGAGRERLSTRVIVVEFVPPGASPAEPVRLGLIAENVVSICSADNADSSIPALELGHAPFLGRLLRLGGQTVQMIAVDRLLPRDLLTGLFPAAARAEDGLPEEPRVP